MVKEELSLDVEKEVVLNKAGLPNKYYTRVMEEYAETLKQHPLASHTIHMAYAITHPLKNIRKIDYLTKLLRSKKDDKYFLKERNIKS